MLIKGFERLGVALGWCLGCAWLVFGGDSNWLASFKDVAGVLRLLPRLRLLHGFYFGGRGCCLR